MLGVKMCIYVCMHVCLNRCCVHIHARLFVFTYVFGDGELECYVSMSVYMYDDISVYISTCMMICLFISVHV